MRSRIYDLGYLLGFLALAAGLAATTLAPVFI